MRNDGEIFYKPSEVLTSQAFGFRHNSIDYIIRINESVDDNAAKKDFERISEAFFAEIESKYL